jgi:hypothetical protein
MGNGDGTFKPAVVYGAGGKQVLLGLELLIADVNGDGKPDVIVINRADQNYGDGTVGVLLGNGDGTLQPVQTYHTGGYFATAGTVADVNGDGKPDVVVTNCGPSGAQSCSAGGASVGVLLGNGDGSFRPVQTYARTAWGANGANAAHVLVADLNHDGKLDVIVGNTCPQIGDSCSADATVDVLLGHGDGTFSPAVGYDSGIDYVSDLALGDFNSDGNLDVAITAGGVGGMGVLLGKGDGTFQSVHILPGAGSAQVLVADLDLDGNLDLVGFGGPSAIVYLGAGDGTFGAPQEFSPGGGGAHWFTIADLNGDHKPDLLAANWCEIKNCSHGEGSVSVLLHVNFTTKIALATSGSPSKLGQPVTFTATVTSKSGAIPDGESVKFYDGTSELGSQGLSGGTASFTTSSLSAGRHTVKALYAGDGQFKSSVKSIVQVVEK